MDKIRETVNFECSYQTHINLHEYCAQHEIDVVQSMGVLNDYLFINANKEISIGRYKARKYVIAYPTYQNQWSNRFMIMMTDKRDEIMEFAKKITTKEEYEYMVDNF